MSLKEPLINVVGFLMLGLCNNFGYAIMLSAAKDLIGAQAPAGVVLLCDILPSFLIVLLFPTVQHRVKTSFCIVLASCLGILGFVLAALSINAFQLGLVGTVLISCQQGIGECAVLAYSSFFQSVCIAAWSTGTGLAGLMSSFLYMLLTQILHVQYDLIIWCFLTIPFLLLISFFIIRPVGLQYEQISDSDDYIKNLKIGERLKLLKPHLLIYISMFFVFLFEYSIMQGVDAALDYPSNPGSFYTFSCFAAQIGVFLARTSLFLFKLSYKWIPALFIVQALNLVVFSLEGAFYFIGQFWVMLVYVAIMGLCGGLTYVNGVYQLQIRSQSKEKKFLLSVAGMWLNAGILCAAGVGSLLESALKK